MKLNKRDLKTEKEFDSKSQAVLQQFQEEKVRRASGVEDVGIAVNISNGFSSKELGIYDTLHLVEYLLGRQA